MNNSNIVAWIKSGNINIPTALLTHYNKMNLNETEMVLIVHLISFFEKGNQFPTHEQLSNRMSIDCTNSLRRLIQKGFIEIIDGFIRRWNTI